MRSNALIASEAFSSDKMAERVLIHYRELVAQNGRLGKRLGS